jgi:hypothetical protein
MSGVVGAIADPAKLGQVVLYSLIAGVGVSTVLGLAVSSAAGLLDALRERRNAAAVAWGTLTTVCVLVIAATIVIGIVVMSTK